jgi:hypothetical protein
MKLSAWESRMADAIARSLLPPGSLGGRVDAIDAGAQVASQLARSPWWSALSVRGALWLVWLAPLWAWRPRTFAALDEQARVALLERLASSSSYLVRESVMLLKLTLCFALIGDPPMLAHLGAYDFGPRGAEANSSSARTAGLRDGLSGRLP